MNQRKILLLLVVFSALLFASILVYAPHELSVNDLIKNQETLNGKEILLHGEVSKVNCIVTTLDCPDCNFASCALALTNGNVRVFLINDTRILKCSGVSSQLKCDLEPGNYTFRGIFLVKGSEFYLDIKQIL